MKTVEEMRFVQYSRRIELKINQYLVERKLIVILIKEYFKLRLQGIHPSGKSGQIPGITTDRENREIPENSKNAPGNCVFQT